MKKIIFLGSLFLMTFSFKAIAQKQYPPGSKGMLPKVIVVPSIADQIKNGTAIYPGREVKKALAKGRHGAKVIPGKGGELGPDPLAQLQRNTTQRPSRAPNLVFEADNTPQANVTDPTGAAGPNHYIGAWNVGFRIFDKSGNPLTPEMSLATLFPGNTLGDPIVFFDANVDNGAGQPRGRFVITEFRELPTNGFDIAVSAGPDPVNDGWFVYASEYETGAFPDYTKFAVWGDSYIVTANVNNGASGDRVFAVERNEMLLGNDAQFVGFPLPEIVAQGFYSPHGFHTTGDQAVPAGVPAPIVFQQDNNFNGTDEDHIKIWGATIDWENPDNHSIALEQSLFGADGVTPFVGEFDGGSFSNRPQLGGPDIDVLQNTMMNQVQYRRFGTHNSVVFNFVINTEGTTGELAGIRWYELRQDADGMPWSVFQEGTYTAPDGRDAYAGSMVMNSAGDIAMGYTSSSASDMISIRYTGRRNGDVLNVMTFAEELIAQSTAPNPGNRLADYVQMSIDPEDDSFWHIAEYFSPQRSDVVGNFNLLDPLPDDIGITSIDSPVDASLTNAEDIVVSIRNFGSNDITNPMVQYSIDGVDSPAETFMGTIVAGATESFTFTTQADLGVAAQTYTIEATTLLADDSNTDNDATSIMVTNTEGQICIPQTTGGCNIDGIKRFILGDINADDGGDGCNTEPATSPTGYADRTDLVTDLNRADGDNEHLLQAQQNWGGGVNVSRFSVWIDFNDDMSFESSEQLIIGEFFTAVDALTDFILTIPTDAPLGPHLLRAKGIDASAIGDVNDPCADSQFGEVQDYTVNIVDVLSVEDTLFDTTSFNISTTDSNMFTVNATTQFEGRAAITVFDMLGKRLVYNNLIREGSTYTYNLDMSFVASGIYIVKFIDIDGGSSIVEKIVVE